LRRIESLWRERDRLWRLYEDELSDVEELRLLRTLPDSRHARHLFTVLVPPNRRDSILWTLQSRGIGVAVNYRPIHLLKYYRETFGYKEGNFPVAEEIGASTISLPLYPSLDDEDVSYVANTLKNIIKG